MENDLLIVKARENCRVSNYLVNTSEHLKGSIEELDTAIKLLGVVHFAYSDELAKMKAVREILEELSDKLDTKAAELFNEATALTDRAKRMND